MDSGLISNELVTFAKRYQREAAATLVQVIRDENAAPMARISASREILSYASGRPTTARPITSADLRLLTYEEKLALFTALAQDPELAHLRLSDHPLQRPMIRRAPPGTVLPAWIPQRHDPKLIEGSTEVVASDPPEPARESSPGPNAPSPARGAGGLAVTGSNGAAMPGDTF